MPVMRCTKDGKSGHKWGPNGVCFIGDDSEAKAAEVGRAINADSLTEYREDIGSDIQSRLDDNGYLRIDGIAAKSGILTYLLPDGTIRREFVPAETLFNADSIASLIGAPVTVEHPGVLTAETAATHSRGSVPTAVADGHRLKVSVVVTSQDGINAVQSGKRQLSPGYRAELDFTPGEYEGQKYDAVQTRRIYNHLAIVGAARGGSECRLNLDGVNSAVEVPNQPTADEVIKMPSVKLHSGATVEVADASTASAIQAEINVLSTRADAADKMVDQAKYDELQGKYDALTEEMEKMKGKKSEKMDADQIGSYIETIEQAKKLKPDVELKADGVYLDETAIMAAAMGIDATGKSPEYVKGRFDSAVELMGTESIKKQREDRQDGDDVKPTLTGRAKFMAEQQKRGA